MRRSLFLLCALLAAPATAEPSPAGCYDGGATEIAAALELRADGRFAYVLAYGALDERAQGRWENDQAGVILVGDPVMPPRFSLVGEGAGPPGGYRLLLDPPAGLDAQYFDAVLTLADGRTIERQFGHDGLVVPLAPDERVVAARLRLDLFGLLSDPFPLTGGPGREARFGFAPNDLQQVRFDRTLLRREGGDLLLERHDRLLRFRRDESICR